VVFNLPELIKEIFKWLSIKTVCKFTLVCKSWLEVIDQTDFWKIVLERDFPDFIHSKTAEEAPEQSIEYIKRINLKLLRVYNNFLDLEKIIKPQSYREQYIRFHRVPNLSGIWLSYYSGHGLEVIKVEQKGYLITATKLKGDLNVPTGKITFQVIFRNDCTAALGKIQLAEVGFRNPHWGFCLLYDNSSPRSISFWKVWIEPNFFIKSLFWKSPQQNLTKENITPAILEQLEESCPVSKKDANENRFY